MLDDSTWLAEVWRRHDAAVNGGQQLYPDPRSGLWVMTHAALAARGWCCGKVCRHCPYPAAEQARAGRSASPPPLERP